VVPISFVRIWTRVGLRTGWIRCVIGASRTSTYTYNLERAFEPSSPATEVVALFCVAWNFFTVIRVFARGCVQRGKGAWRMGYRNRGCVVKPSGSSNSSRRTSSGLYECSSPHSSHMTKKGPLTERDSNASVSASGILCPTIMFSLL